MNSNNINSLRYQCNSLDDINTYGWESFNGIDYGKQIIDDTGNKLELTTEFYESSNSSISLRVSGNSRSKSIREAPQNISIFFAISVIGSESDFIMSRISPKTRRTGYQGNTAFFGSSSDLKDFGIYFMENGENKHPSESVTVKGINNIM